MQNSVSELMVSVQTGKRHSSEQQVSGYLEQLRSITIIRHLIPVIVASQQHRGANLALLEGDKFFRDKITELQDEIDNRLQNLNILNKEMNSVVADAEFNALMHEWDTVKNWSGGPSLENYNLHSHFIEKQMKLVWQIAENTSCFISYPAVTDTDNTYKIPDDNLLIRFILHETPELIELIARIRGLATYASAIGTCNEDIRAKIEYMLTILNQKKEKFRILSKQLQKYVLRDVPALIELQMQDVRIIQLAELVKNTIMKADTIDSNDHAIFNLATNIINSQTEIVKQGLDYIQRKVHQQFDAGHL